MILDKIDSSLLIIIFSGLILVGLLAYLFFTQMQQQQQQQKEGFKSSESTLLDEIIEDPNLSDKITSEPVLDKVEEVIATPQISKQITTIMHNDAGYKHMGISNKALKEEIQKSTIKSIFFPKHSNIFSFQFIIL